jgi:hypothetical protein
MTVSMGGMDLGAADSMFEADEFLLHLLLASVCGAMPYHVAATTPSPGRCAIPNGYERLKRPFSFKNKPTTCN